MLTELDVNPIGTVIESTYQTKWGTPRQGQLTPGSIATIQLECATIHTIGTRIGIVWSAHLNGNKFNPMKGKIKPPKLLGKSIGVFATRGVHRPSSIGLSFCNISSVTDNGIVVTGADMIVGTPILAIHVAQEWTETIACPKWAMEINTVKVFWSLASFVNVTLLGATKCQISVFDVINRILSQDPRSIHSIKNHHDPVYEMAVHAGCMQLHVTYRHRNEAIEVLFITQERIVPEFPERSEKWLHKLKDKVRIQI